MISVIVPCLNFGTALSSLILFGLKPVLVDININTLQIDEKKIVEKITKKTKALMIPNLIGNLPDWNAISRIAKKYRLKIIADSADTIGCSFNKKPLGKYADLIITSFYGSHVISCAGNGGMLILNKKNEYLLYSRNCELYFICIKSWITEIILDLLDGKRISS